MYTQITDRGRAVPLDQRILTGIFSKVLGLSERCVNRFFRLSNFLPQTLCVFQDARTVRYADSLF